MTALNLTALAPLIGKWRTRAFTEDRVFGPGVPVTITEEFYWLEGGHFLVQTYETVFGDEPAQRGINYWFHDSETGKFRIIFFSNNGAFTEDGNRYEGQIVGTALTFVGPARFQYELDANGRIKKDDDGTITVSLRDDRGQFQPWMTNVFRRVGTLERQRARVMRSRFVACWNAGWPRSRRVTSTACCAIVRTISSCSTCHDLRQACEAFTRIATHGPRFLGGFSKGMFEFDTLEVTAGDDVAFAHALLRCSTRETLQNHPDKRLCLTVGLRKTGGRHGQRFPQRSLVTGSASCARLLAAGDQLTRPVGQTSARWQVLGAIDGASRSVAQIARVMGLTRQSVQRTADLLQGEGVISYTENPRHQRAKLVTLTTKGRSVLDWITRQQIAWVNELTTSLHETELRRALTVIRAFREVLEQADVQGPKQTRTRSSSRSRVSVRSGQEIR